MSVIAGDGEPLVPDEALQLLASWTGTSDLPFLRSHVLSFWRSSRAKHHTYKCIQELGFLHPRFPTHPSYTEFIQVMLSDPSRRVLEVGCCFGTDVRFLLLQGVQPSQVVATDLHSGYYELGKEFFSVSKTETTGTARSGFSKEQAVSEVRTVFGDIAATHDTDPQAVNLADFILREGFDFVSCFAVLHVLSKDQVKQCLGRLYKVLKPGGTLFGWCVGRTEPGLWMPTPDGKAQRYLHSPSSLMQELEAAGFSSIICSELQLEEAWVQAAIGQHRVQAEMERVMRISFTCKK